MAIVEVGTDAGFVPTAAVATPVTLITGPASGSFPNRTLIVRSFVVVNRDNAATPIVSIGVETGSGTITDADSKHYFCHNEPIVKRKPFEITNLKAAATAIRVYIVCDTLNGVLVKWAGFYVDE